MRLDNEPGANPFPLPVGRTASPDRQRAVIVGQVWSADLAESLLDTYSYLIKDGYSLEDVSRLVQDLPDDSSGD